TARYRRGTRITPGATLERPMCTDATEGVHLHTRDRASHFDGLRQTSDPDEIRSNALRSCLVASPLRLSEWIWRPTMYRQLTAPLILLSAGVVFGLPTLRAVQEPVPIKGTIALEGTVDKTYAAANTLIVKATNGVKHLFHVTKQTVMHGETDERDATVSGLRSGTRVVVHYAQ